jgi:chromosome segregation ATPase
MSASSEALALVALVANGPKYRERLQELIAITEKAEAATANLKTAEQASAEKLAVAETLLASLQAQCDEFTAANAAAAAKIAAAEADLARRSAELEAAKAEHAAQVSSALQDLTVREEELALKRAALDEHVATHTKVLHDGQGRLRASHLALRTIIGETRQGIATVS